MMFERFFQWAMYRAARILFLIAVLIILLGLGPNLWTILSEASRMRRELGVSPGSPSVMAVNAVMSTLLSAAFPFLGAALLHFGERFFATQRNLGSDHA
jgi:hypothetical protein